VRITGVSGPQADQIRGALRGAALAMTTLDVDVARLRGAVERYPDVVSLGVTTHFPHALVIHVTEQIPLATVTAGGREIAVSASGELLRPPTHADGRLPQLPVRVLGGRRRVTNPGTRAVLSVLARAPWPMVGRIARAHDSAQRGIVLSLRNGPELLFGSPTNLGAKWAAALAVLAASTSAGAAYVDVSDPARPAAGGPTTPATTTTFRPAPTGTSGSG
jgi:cell division protein FtsQ